MGITFVASDWPVDALLVGTLGLIVGSIVLAVPLATERRSHLRVLVAVDVLAMVVMVAGIVGVYASLSWCSGTVGC